MNSMEKLIKKRFRLGLFLVLICSMGRYVFADNPNELAGDLPKVLTVDKSPYLVVADVYVPAGKIVHIEPGTIILFKNFTSLHIRGMLIARGTSLRTIVFTSENDHQYNPSIALNPTPYDWNGIYIHKDGVGTELENVHVTYSVKGIVSETKFFKIAGGIFSENGRSNLSIEGEEVVVVPLVPFAHDVSIKDATVNGVPVKILRDPEAPRRNFFRYSGAGLCIGSAVFAGVFGYQWYRAEKEYEKASSLGHEIPNGYELVENAKSDRHQNMNLTIGGGALFFVGSISFVYSYSF
jgi:hypothetical protein